MDRKKKGVALSIALILLTKKRQSRKKRWIKDWMRKKAELNHFNLINELRVTKENDFKNYMRMRDSSFQKLLSLVSPYLKKKDTHMRKSLTPEEKLAVTLRFLATGRSFEDLKYSTLLFPRAISGAVLDTCNTLIYVLQDYLKTPSTQQEWREVADDFGRIHGFPTCLGSLDGKHVGIIMPKNAGSRYFNYKGFHSIILLALVNARKEFMMVDVGINGRISDGGVLFYSKFWQSYEQGLLNLPNPINLSNMTLLFPYVFVADEAFALGPNLMKPYSQKNS
ncbi:unnamed protein product [Parnassius mnemosyne]|uniref:DDE Tnp4 domain-containing protein n=1 Tax=Parnassius mnemosyne TaxID=213953 RepID=A0AAV1KKZ9_9NEOP